MFLLYEMTNLKKTSRKYMYFSRRYIIREMFVALFLIHEYQYQCGNR